jgi:serine/threonine-protein kinase PRP4
MSAPQKRQRSSSPVTRNIKQNASVRLEVVDSPDEAEDWGLEQDEEALIEERRRKRLEILAKHTVSQPKALVISQTEGKETSSKDHSLSKDNLSKDYSPLKDHSKQQNLTQRHIIDVERIVQGDTAADYDALEDKMAEQRRRQAITHAPKQTKEVVKELDMFAEDVEDHQFDAAQSTAALALDADAWDDAEGYYRFVLNDKMDRYIVTDNLGKGVFSNVVKARDAEGMDVAIKVIRNNEIMYKAGLKEMTILEKLATNDPNDKRHVIRLLGHFEHRNHLCLVFESMSINLREILKKFGRDVGISIKAVRSYAHQILQALALMQKCNILHADIKPDNILVNESHNVIKVADFGSASDASENELTPYLVSRFYRAPEVIMGFPYDFSMDMWSVGCTIFELYTGKILFPGRDNNQMLKLHMDLAGRFPVRMIRRGKFCEQHFNDGNFLQQEVDRVTGNDVVKQVAMPAKPVHDIKQRIMASLNKTSEEVELVKQLADLLDKMLKLDPSQRISASEALQHNFFSK